jgi:hypothetical protein
MRRSSAKAEEGQDEHDDHDQADEVNDAVHELLLWAGAKAGTLRARNRATAE